MWDVTLRHFHETIVAVEKQYVLHISVCVDVAILTQHARLMHHIILLSVACLASPHFSTLS